MVRAKRENFKAKEKENFITWIMKKATKNSFSSFFTSPTTVLVSKHD